MVALCISRKLRDRSEQDFDRRGETCTVADAANGINQYTSITHNETPFIPTFDADGNQTLVQSSTGIWTVVYNAENRPISFTKIEGEQTSIIECGYDYMGRRSTKKVTVNGALTLHQRYIYRGYLQIACVDLLRGGHPALWYTLWDPSEPIATRPLAIQKNGTWYTYGHDLTKNVTELYNADATIASTYDYTPFGSVTATGTEQAFQWSSEFYDDELALTYYNYRHYNPLDGRWINRDPIGENGGMNLYRFVNNFPVFSVDVYGLIAEDNFTNEAKNFIKDNCKCFLATGRSISGMSEDEIIATAMAIAEELSTRQGFKSLIDNLQDARSKKGLSVWPTTDIGKGNINTNTAKGVDTSPLKYPENIKKSLDDTLKNDSSRRQFLTTNEGTILVGLLEMKSMSNKVASYMPANMEQYKKAQVNVNAWREGDKILDRIKKGKDGNDDAYEPSPGDNLDQYKANYDKMKKLLKECEQNIK